MTFPFAELDLRFGFVLARAFSSLGFYNPWPSPFQRADVTFNPPFDDDEVQVFLTPTKEDILPSDHHAAVVGVAHKVTKSGFELSARSTDCGAGFSSFNWLAINRKPLGPQRHRPGPTLEIRMARVQPLHEGELKYVRTFTANCIPGDTAQWPRIPYSRPFETATHDPLSPIVFITQSTTDYDPALPTGFGSTICASVGMLRNTSSKDFGLAARNFDKTLGAPKYNYVALARHPGATQSLSNIEDLRVTSGDFLFTLEAGGWSGDWGALPIYFDAPFLAPPIILMTAQTRDPSGDVRAFLGIANHADQYGFTISVRNADFEAGTVTMNWVAFGCGQACGN
jgi:hypothetical protein